MTKHSFSIKSLLFTAIVAFSLLLGSNVWAFANSFSSVRADSSSNDVITTASTSIVPVQTFDFENESGSMPISPTSFETIGGSNSPIQPAANGVISLESTSFSQNKAKYGFDDTEVYPSETLPTQFNLSNQKALLINAGGSLLNFGYKLKTSVNLSRASFYEIKTLVYTHPNAEASIYLAGDDFNDLETSQIARKNTHHSWQEFAFYVSTADTHASDVNIELYLGSKAHKNQYSASTSKYYALFDNIKITRLSGEAFAAATATQDEFMSVVNLNSSSEITSGAGFVKNGNFALGASDWTDASDTDSSSSGQIQFIKNLNQQVNVNDKKVIFGTHQATDASKSINGVVLSVKNGANVSIKSSDITIKQHQNYRISLWAKGDLSSSALAIKISGRIDNATEDGQEFSQTITAFDTNIEAINGSWGLYEFYVVGNPLFDTTVNLYLGLTSSSSANSGYVAVADIRSYLVDSKQMTAGTAANTNAKTLNMFSTSNTLSFGNYTFNLVELTETNFSVPNYPLTPKDWTAKNSKNTNSGVVNLNPSIWAQTMFANTARPSKNKLTGYSDNDNVLLINGDSGQYQEFSSNSETLSANGYALITFQAYVDSTSNAYVYVKNKDGIILSKITLTDTNAQWKTYSIYLHNYFNEQTVSVTLALGSEPTSEQSSMTVNGKAYFDNVKFDNSITEENFNSAVSNSTTYIYDLNKDALTATVSPTDSTPLMWNLKTTENANNANVNSGIFDHYAYDSTTFMTSDPKKPAGLESDKILVIQSSQPVYSAFESTLSYSFAASTYYKLSVWVKTNALTPDTETPDDYTDDGKLIVHGASIIVTNIDSSFISINTADNALADENGWVQYIFYIYATDATTSKIQLGLGCEGMPTAGFAYFAGLDITSLEEDDYKNETLAYETEELPSNVLLATNVPAEDEETTGSSGLGSFDPFAFSTILIAIAVVVAILGVLIKKVRANAPKKTKKVTSSYDRLQTLLKDVDRRERKTAVNHKLKLLREELAQSQSFLAEEVSELKKQTESYDTAKEIAKDNPNIELCAPDIKQLQKEIEIQSKKIEQIEYDIEVLEQEKARIEKQTKQATKKLDVTKNTKTK